MGARALLDDLHTAGLTITADGDRLVIWPASKLTDDMRTALRAAKSELLAELGARPAKADPAALPTSPVRRWRLSQADADRCHAGGWDDAEIVAFTARHVRLLAHGLTNGHADDLAERLTLRDRDGDDRLICTDCRHYRAGRCGNHRPAGLNGPEVGRDLATMLQRCPGFQTTR